MQRDKKTKEKTYYFHKVILREKICKKKKHKNN